MINATTKFILGFILGCSSFVLTAQTAFSDISVPSGFNDTGINRGVAIGDFDNDGDDDAYVSRHNLANILYQNNGDGTFTDVAESYGLDYAGETHVSVWGDFDNDGHLDLYLGNRNTANVLYHNNGDGTFSDIAIEAGVNSVSNARSLLLADVNLDGYLDIYIANILAENVLYQNNGDLTFTDVTQASGTSDPQISMGAMFFDYDNDGDPDLYLTHDAQQPYILLQNDGTGNFTDVSQASGTNYAGQGMGVDFGDINNDGWLDIYITNLSLNTLYLNNGDGTFEDISQSAMITDPGMGWGITFLDHDNDGLQDIYMVNDSYFSPMPNILYRNNGDNTFDEVSENTPIGNMYASFGTACTDINADGMIDVFVTNSGSDDGNQLFQNNTQNAGNWFRLKLTGTISNRSAIGAKVTITAGGKIHTDEVSGGSGYASQNSFNLHFGLGAEEMIDELMIRWPNGLVETYTDLPANQSMSAIENESITVGSNAVLSNMKVETFPNPVTETLHIFLENVESSNLEITVSNILGDNITTIFSGQLRSGNGALQWTPSANLSSGVYFLAFRMGNEMMTRKIMIK